MLLGDHAHLPIRLRAAHIYVPRIYLWNYIEYIILFQEPIIMSNITFLYLPVNQKPVQSQKGNLFTANS